METLTETILVPRELLQELTERLAEVEEVVATMEELSDHEGVESVKKTEGDLTHGRFKVAKTPEEIKTILG